MPEQKPKRIVIDARARRSSTGRYADRLIDHLQKIDKDNKYLLLLAPDDDYKPKAKNFEAISCGFKQFSFNPMEQIGFTRQLYQLKPDLVHFTMTQQPIFYFSNIITTTHDLTMFNYTRPKGRFLPIFWLMKLGYLFLFWWGHKKSKRIIVPSRYVRVQLARFEPFTEHKTKMIYEATEPVISLHSKKPKKAEKPYILYVGTAFPHKNLKRLVKAFEAVEAKKPDLHLYLVGKREYYYEKLGKHIAKSPAAKNIKTLGFVSDDELRWLYSHAEAYVFPSLSEGFGLPGLEAMAHSCPVVSSNATCLPEIYGDAAHYFDPENVEAMSEAIEKVLDTKQLRDRLIKAGNARVKKYSWDKMARQTLEIYQSLLN